MCLICIEIEKERLTPLEARKNLSEMRNEMPEEHRIEVLRLIWKKEDEQQKLLDEARLEQEAEDYEGMVNLWRTFGGD
tara:strand:- start:9971 stop:10204 length:234 start_codon:yes stop_codon:yes gene_type:complete